jgi:hypothetical protein
MRTTGCVRRASRPPGWPVSGWAGAAYAFTAISKLDRPRLDAPTHDDRLAKLLLGVGETSGQESQHREGPKALRTL